MNVETVRMDDLRYFALRESSCPSWQIVVREHNQS
jgi:hypothetical protein